MARSFARDRMVARAKFVRVPKARESHVAERAIEYHSALATYFLRRTLSREDAEDLSQEVFLRLLGTASPPQIGSLRGYVFQVANSVFIDWLRRSKARAAGAHDDISERLADDSASCERSMLARERLDRVVERLGELPEKTRTILVMRRLDEEKNAAIANRLGVSLSTVEKHIHQGTAHLKDRLDEFA